MTQHIHNQAHNQADSQVKQEAKSAQDCNYTNNYYGDCVCVMAVKQGK